MAQLTHLRLGAVSHTTIVSLTSTRASHCRPRHHDAAEAPPQSLVGHMHIAVEGRRRGPGAPSHRKTRRRSTRGTYDPHLQQREPTGSRRVVAWPTPSPLGPGRQRNHHVPTASEEATAPAPERPGKHGSGRHPSGSGQLRRGSGRRPRPRRCSKEEGKEGRGWGRREEGGELMAPPPPSSLPAGLPASNSGGGAHGA